LPLGGITYNFTTPNSSQRSKNTSVKQTTDNN